MRNSKHRIIKGTLSLLGSGLVLATVIAIRMAAETGQHFAFLEKVKADLADPQARAEMLANPRFISLSGLSERQSKIYKAALDVSQQGEADRLISELRMIDPQKLSISEELKHELQELRESGESLKQEEQEAVRTRGQDELNQAWKALRQKECEALKLSNCEAPLVEEQAYSEGELKGLPLIANLAFGLPKGLEQYFKDSGFKLSSAQLKQSQEQIAALRSSAIDLNIRREELRITLEREQTAERLRKEKLRILQAKLEQDLLKSLNGLVQRESPGKLRLSTYSLLGPKLGLNQRVKEG